MFIAVPVVLLYNLLMSDVKVKIDNAKVEKALDTFLPPYLNGVKDSTVSACKQECPVKTGALKADIQGEVDTRNIYVGNNLRYSIYINLGTRYMAPNPYLIRGMHTTSS